MNSRPFTAYGQPMALNPRAFGMVCFEPPAPPEAKDVGNGVFLIDVRGPLMHHADPFCDSYDAIKARVQSAIAANARKVLLSIDSPGGLVSGCFDTADEIRSVCDSAGVELVAYVDGQATSAAYALACVASKVYVPSTGIVGSIGVIDALVDATAQDRQMGVTFSLIASGARKTDGNPHASTTDAALVAAQSRVDALAGLFFDHVSRRRGIASAEIAGLQAGLVHGADAVSKGLADDVKTLDQVLALLAGTEPQPAATAAATTVSSMEENETAYRASLQAVVDDDKADEKAKARAKAILAAMDGEPDGDEGDKKPEPKGEGDEPPADEKHDEPDGDEKPKAAAPSAAEAMASRALALAERGERARLFATRPDLTDAQRKDLAKVSVDALEGVLRAIPRNAGKPAATVTVSATRGEGQGGADTARTPESLVMAQAMGLAPVGESGVVRKGSTIFFHAQHAPKAGAR